MTTTLLARLHQAARNYAELGWDVFPLQPQSKKPATDHGPIDATADKIKIDTWWNDNPQYNIGIRAGKKLVIDFDMYKPEYAGHELYDLLSADYPTAEQETPGGGRQMIYMLPNGFTWGNGRGDLPAGIDIRSNNGYIAAAPSIHPNGGTYVWLSGRSPKEFPLQPLPKIVIDLLTAKAERAAHQTTTQKAAAPLSLDDNALLEVMWRCKPHTVALWEGKIDGYSSPSEADQALCNQLAWVTGRDRQRIDRLFRQSDLMRDKWLRDDYREITIDTAIKDTHGVYDPNYRSNSDPSVIDGNPADLVGNPTTFTNGHTAAGQAGQNKTSTPPPASSGPTTNYLLTLPFDDEGVAECTLSRYDGQFLHTESHGWLQYTGTHWKAEGAEAAVERAITETLNARIQAALAAGAQNYSELIKRSARNSRGVKAAKSQLQSHVHTDISNFDNDPTLLNCKNGVVDLRTGQLNAHDKNQRFMYCIEYNYNPNADWVDWVNWLSKEVGADNTDWLQMAQGYSLTGHTNEEILIYFYGPTRSGKGTYTSAILKMLGKPLAKAAQFSTFTATRGGDDQNFDLAPLKPCRLIVASESNQYERFNEAKIKQITGGDEIRCAFKRQTHFEYKPQFTIWLSSNHPVNADPDDDAVWGRIRVIEFPNSYLGREDKTLKSKMQTEAMLEAILAWSVAGAMRWYALGSKGLPELPASAAIKQKQRIELDYVQQWLDECCLFDDPNNPPQTPSVCPNEDIRKSYESWCYDNGVTAKGKKNLTQALRKKGFNNNDGKVINYNDFLGNRQTKRGFYGIKIK